MVVKEGGAMGRVYIVSGDPQPRGIDLSAGASGWERLRTFARRLWNG
jgi:hypothetical protein